MYIDSYHTMKEDNDYTFVGDNSRQDELYMGFELEVDEVPAGEDSGDWEEDNESSVYECTEEIANATPENLPEDFLHFEEDGSLESGFEMISQPASLSQHLTNLAPHGFYDRIGRICSSYGFTSHDNGRCGLHIHLDKAFFGKSLDSASAKLLFLFERHWDNLYKFSRRRSAHWCHRYVENSGYRTRDARGGQTVKLKEIIDDAKDHCIDRYFAVNLSNDNTIEIRLWRGTLNRTTLLATFKLTARLAQLAKDTPAVKLAAMSWKDILGDDPDILAYASTRGLL